MHVVTLVRRDSNRWRFWEATIDGPVIEIATGQVGSEGDADYQQFASPTAAFEWLEREVAERRAEGYVDPERRQDVGALGPATLARNADLEAKLEQDPDDIDTYLVYADWLESEGDPRGRLITLHHRLQSDPDNGELSRAESELLLHYADHFFPEHGPNSALEARWHLGFIRRAVIGCAASLRRLLKHPSAALLQELAIGGFIKTDAFAEAVIEAGPFPTLRHLRVKLGEGEPLPEAVWAQMPHLEEVIIDGDGAIEAADTSRWTRLEVGESEGVLDALATSKWPRLHTLTVDFSALDAEALMLLFDGHSMPALRELSMSLDAEELPALASTPLFQQLEIVRMRDSEIYDANISTLIGLRPQLAHLQLFDVSHNYLSPDSIEALKAFEIQVVTAPQHYDDDEFDDDYYDDYGYDPEYYDADDQVFSADVVPVYEKDEETEDDGELAIDKTWQRGVVGFDHDD